VLITGDPGIGKTQLARYFRRWADEQGAHCFYARFFDYEAAASRPTNSFEFSAKRSLRRIKHG
jgi:KaiC/GvpD/RAD55 family RecA-like ATPase